MSSVLTVFPYLKMYKKKWKSFTLMTDDFNFIVTDSTNRCELLENLQTEENITLSKSNITKEFGKMGEERKINRNTGQQ